MNVIKPFVAVSRRGMFAAFFDTEDAALAYAQQKAEANYATMAVARVMRTIEPGGQETVREPAPVVAPEPVSVPAVHMSLPEGVASLVEIANG